MIKKDNGEHGFILHRLQLRLNIRSHNFKYILNLIVVQTLLKKFFLVNIIRIYWKRCKILLNLFSI